MTREELATLTNSEFEVLIAQIAKSMEYDVEIVPSGKDVGIDVIARNKCEALAIQAKKFINRKINLEMVYHTYAACAFHDCTKPIIATLSILTPNAEKAARKLNVQIWDYNFISSSFLAVSDLKQKVKGRDFFDCLWSDHFVSLEGKKVQHLKNDTTILIKTIDDNGISLISSNGKERHLPIAIFKWAVYNLKTKGILTRSEINDEYKNRASSAISAILATLPYVDVDSKEKIITLKWKEI